MQPGSIALATAFTAALLFAEHIALYAQPWKVHRPWNYVIGVATLAAGWVVWGLTATGPVAPIDAAISIVTKRSKPVPPQTHGNITILVILLTFCLNALFGILIARACWRAYSRQDTDEYLKVVFLNDSLERIRDGVLREMISWAAI